MAIYCEPSETRLVWRGITIEMSGDPTLTTRSEISGLDLVNVDTTDLPVQMGSQGGRIAWPARDVAATKILCRAVATTELLRRAMITPDADAPLEPLDVDAPALWEGTRRLYVHPRRCTSTLARDAMMTRVTLRNLQWTALDPRWLSPEDHEFVLDGLDGVEVEQVGNYAAPWRAELDGPVTSPYIRRVDTGAEIRWPGVAVGSGQTLTYDSRTDAAFVGLVDVSGLSVDENDLPALGWDFPPDVTVEVATNAPSGSVWVRDAWL